MKKEIDRLKDDYIDLDFKIRRKLINLSKKQTFYINDWFLSENYEIFVIKIENGRVFYKNTDDVSVCSAGFENFNLEELLKLFTS